MQTNGTSYRIAAKENRERLARGLGWFSIGLGLAELLAPRGVARLIGVQPRPGLLRLFGLREIASGIGILAKADPAPGLKSRVAGDAIDLAVMGTAFLSPRTRRGQLALATAAVAGVTALDVLCAREYCELPVDEDRHPAELRGTVHFRKSVTVNRPAEQLYAIWRNFEELPRFMNHLISVRSIGERRWHWVAKGPARSQVEWDAEITEERPNQLIAWRSLKGADVDQAGSVRFEPARGNRGTVVRVEIQYRPPAGKLGAKVAKLLGQAPEKQVTVDLLRFKQLAETGEIARTEGQPSGRGRKISMKFDAPVRA
jgi:uncharacterized membrane protein